MKVTVLSSTFAYFGSHTVPECEVHSYSIMEKFRIYIGCSSINDCYSFTWIHKTGRFLSEERRLLAPYGKGVFFLCFAFILIYFSPRSVGWFPAILLKINIYNFY